MQPIPWRVQLGAVAAGYAMVFLVGAALIFERHLQYVNNPADAASYGGMYAFGDLILGLFIGGLFLVPTIVLTLVIRKSESAYTRYSQILLGLSLTAPICMGVSLIPAVNQGNSFLGWFCMGRLFASPIMIAGLAVSRLLAQFTRAKRLTSYALLVEGGTIVLLVTLLFLSAYFSAGGSSRVKAEVANQHRCDGMQRLCWDIILPSNDFLPVSRTADRQSAAVPGIHGLCRASCGTERGGHHD